jgi:DNA-damage-inducible protein J
MKTVMVTARVNPDLKTSTGKILRELGISTTEAINMFFTQINQRQGIPFSVEIPNAETAKALDDSLAGIDMHRVSSIDQLYQELLS